MIQNHEPQSRLLDELIAFRDERDWEQSHTPKNLASALVAEASELLSILQRTPDSELSARRAEKREEIEREVAEKKMVLNAEHYPADRAGGNARKYAEL